MRHRLLLLALFSVTAACNNPFLHSVPSPNRPVGSGEGLCNDMEVNQDETDIDCGGAACSTRCTPGQSCIVAGDCDSGKCEGDVCIDTQCVDTLLTPNEGESDVDCGRGCPSKLCTAGQTCNPDTYDMMNQLTASDCGDMRCASDDICLRRCPGDPQTGKITISQTGAEADLASYDLCFSMDTIVIDGTDMVTLRIPPRVTGLARFEIRNNNSLTEIVVPAMQTATLAVEVTAQNNPVLSDLSGLSTFNDLRLDFTDNPSLTASDFAFPNMCTGSVRFSGDNGFTVLGESGEFPSVDGLSEFHIDDTNFTRVVGPPAFSGRNPSGSCVTEGGSDSIDPGVGPAPPPSSMVTIDNNTGLTEVQGFVALEAVTLHVHDNPVLATIGGFDAARFVSVDIENSPVSSLAAFPSATLAGTLRLVDTGLTDIAGFDKVALSYDNLIITNNTSLLDISGLNRLTIVFGESNAVVPPAVQINNNGSLAAISGLQNINWIGVSWFVGAEGAIDIDATHCSLVDRIARKDVPSGGCNMSPLSARGEMCVGLNGNFRDCASDTCVWQGYYADVDDEDAQVGVCTSSCTVGNIGMTGVAAGCQMGETCLPNAAIGEPCGGPGGCSDPTADCGMVDGVGRCVGKDPICGIPVPLWTGGGDVSQATLAQTCGIANQVCDVIPGATVSARCVNQMPYGGVCVAPCDSDLECGPGLFCRTPAIDDALLFEFDTSTGLSCTPGDSNACTDPMYPHCLRELPGASGESISCARVRKVCAP